jgi:hypothetical protein
MIALDRLQTIIPSDQALANKALAISLQQIGGISGMTLAQLAEISMNTETNKTMEIVNNQESATTPEDQEYFTNVVGQYGTGPNNTYTMTDIFGLPTGYYVYLDNFDSVISTMGSMNFSSLVATFNKMSAVIAGAYGISPVIITDGEGAGTYPDRDSAVATGLMPYAEQHISEIAAAYPSQTTQLNTFWGNIVTQINREFLVQADANFTFNVLSHSKQSVYSFVYSLQSTYALDTQNFMTAWYLEHVATLTNRYGQSVVSCMRQGRNRVGTHAGGIIPNANVPQNPTPPYPRAELLPAYYTPEEAAKLTIK